MLVSKNLEDKTYQELINDAMMQIPLHSSEWTNYNPSDPGITILENLTAFEVLQENRINQITPVIKQKLLKMAGFEGEKGRCARVLLAAEGVSEEIFLPANKSFLLGDLQYETGKALRLADYRLVKILGKRKDAFYDYSFLTDKEITVPALVFGEKPQVGDSLYFVANRLPEAGEEVIFYLTVADRYNRNPFEKKGGNLFAQMKWECYTENGYEQMNVTDHTGCFLLSGEIRMRMPDKKAVPCPELSEEGYVIRVTLMQADYDVRPKLTSVQCFLFEVWQRETKSACHTFNKLSQVTLVNEFAEEGYLHVFCKEEKGSSYRKYEEWAGEEANGRFFERRQERYGVNTFSFDKRKYGFGPEKLKNAVKVMVYGEEMMRRYYLGEVRGFDDQTIELPMKNIVADSFSIIAKRINEQGEEIYDFVRPNRYEEEALTYHLLENEGKIVIEDAGEFIGAVLYMGGCSVTRGEEGNIRAGSCLKAGGFSEPIRFCNPGPGTGGRFRESIQDVKNRFIEDVKKSYTAVTASDYERLVRETPALCIDKVRAVLDIQNNRVKIAVKPGTDEEFPQLSATYKRALEQQIESRRLLSTKVEIVSPAYLPVNVSGVLYVKRHYGDVLSLAEQTIREKLDYIHSDRNFGEVLKFDEVFQALEALPCVAYIYDLSLFPQYSNMGHLQENDIVPEDNCLCYAGRISLEIRSYEK